MASARCGESLNLAVNLIADVLYTFNIETTIPEYPQEAMLSFFIILALAMALYATKKREAPKR